MNNQTNLTNEEKEELELIISFSPSLRMAHELKEELIAIYNSDITLKGWQAPLNSWLDIDCRNPFHEHNSQFCGDLSWYIEKSMEREIPNQIWKRARLYQQL